MKLAKPTFGVVGAVVAVFFGGVMATGCAVDSEAQRAEARGAAGSFRNSLDDMPAQIDETMSKMMALADNRTGDKSQTLSEFSKSLAKMDADARALSAHADRANQDTEAYFRQWEREAIRSENTSLKDETVAQRRARYQNARAYLGDARKNYLELTENLHAIERMYQRGGIDSTDPGVSAMIEDAIKDSVNVKNSIARLGEQIDTALGVK